MPGHVARHRGARRRRVRHRRRATTAVLRRRARVAGRTHHAQARARVHGCHRPRPRRVPSTGASQRRRPPVHAGLLRTKVVPGRHRHRLEGGPDVRTHAHHRGSRPHRGPGHVPARRTRKASAARDAQHPVPRSTRTHAPAGRPRHVRRHVRHARPVARRPHGPDERRHPSATSGPTTHPTPRLARARPPRRDGQGARGRPRPGQVRRTPHHRNPSRVAAPRRPFRLGLLGRRHVRCRPSVPRTGRRRRGRRRDLRGAHRRGAAHAEARSLAPHRRVAGAAGRPSPWRRCSSVLPVVLSAHRPIPAADGARTSSSRGGLGERFITRAARP